MLQTVKIEKEVNITTLKVSAKVRYWEDAEVNGESTEDGNKIPFKDGDYWRPTINIDAGKVVDWPENTTASIHFKVCDAGVYSLFDEEGNEVKEIDGYVPEMMCPADNGYGDYIIMNIDESGTIEKWNPSFEEFFVEQ